MLDKTLTSWMHSRVLTVDPGLSGKGTTGWAYWQYLYSGSTTPISERLKSTGLLQVDTPKKNWLARAEEITEKFYWVCQNLNPAHVFIEFPEYQTSARGLSSVAGGGLFKLVYLAGMLGRATVTVGAPPSPGHTQVHLVSPSGWKGQLDKRALERRVRKHFTEDFPPHILDAVGLGLALEGLL